VGKTVPAYRIAIEWEIARWKKFRDALPSELERQAWDALMDLVRVNAMAAQNACNPVLFEPMAMSILLGHQELLMKLEKEIEILKQNLRHDQTHSA
jgi:hypothetical protein